MTVRDLISASMRLIGVLSGNEAPSANEATNALATLTDMIDSWSEEQLLIYAKVTESFPLVVGQQSYQMGTGAPDFNTARPQKIENAQWVQVNGSISFQLPIDIINQDEWNAITVPTTTSNIPTKLFVNYTYPYATLNFWPIPQQVNTFTMWSWKPLSSLGTLDSNISMPPGYSEAIRYNLAARLAPEYGKQLDQLIIAMAVDTKAGIKRMNSKFILSSIDAALLPQRRTFNYFTGQ